LGTLLKVVNESGDIGYSDLFPWPEYGDLGIKEQIENIQKENFSKLAQVSLSLAQRDLRARKGKKSLYQPRSPIKNNFLLTDSDLLTLDLMAQLKSLGFTTIKMKAGLDADKEKFYLQRILESGDFLARVDFNSTMNWNELERFIAGLKLTSLEYCEDPFSYEKTQWAEARKMVRLALDWEQDKISWSESSPPECDVLVLKPARQDLFEILPALTRWKKKITLTSAMDHPVGVMHALSWMQEWAEVKADLMLIAGCLSFQAYEENAYSKRIPVKGPCVLASPGRGVGFDDLLEREPWQQIL
jgi:O-succinylbenzoate synthase